MNKAMLIVVLIEAVLLFSSVTYAIVGGGGLK